MSLAILLGCFVVAKSGRVVDFLEFKLCCFAGGGVCFRKGKEEIVGAGLYPSLMKCHNFVVKLSKLSLSL